MTEENSNCPDCGEPTPESAGGWCNCNDCGNVWEVENESN